MKENDGLWREGGGLQWIVSREDEIGRLCGGFDRAKERRVFETPDQVGDERLRIGLD